MLGEPQLDSWMATRTDNADSLRTLLVLAPEEWLVAEPASPLVNNVKNDGPDLLATTEP